MGIKVNTVLMNGGGSIKDDGLPEGVYKNPGEDAEWVCPEGRTELFRTDALIFTAPTSINPQVTVRYMRNLRKSGSQDTALANLLFDVLGESVMDALADEDLSEDEFALVMKVVEKHVLGVTRRLVGK